MYSAVSRKPAQASRVNLRDERSRTTKSPRRCDGKPLVEHLCCAMPTAYFDSAAATPI
jgi:hypothetical protein